jgi:hypothetical protein
MLNDLNNRKIDITGDFKGTLNGMPIVAADPGLASTVAFHSEQINDSNDRILTLETTAVPFTPDLVGKKIEIVAGTIRQNATDRTKWDYISDSLHTPVGVSGTYATALSSQITIPFKKNYSKVISFVCGTDETFANEHNMTVGASVGTDSAIIKASATIQAVGKVAFDNTDFVVTPNAGTDLGYVSAYNSTNGTLNITHKYCPGASIMVSPYFSGYNASSYFMPLVYSVSDGAFAVRFIDVTTGNYYTGVASNKMAFTFSKIYAEGLKLDGTSSSDTMNLDQGNIWFFGIFEV